MTRQFTYSCYKETFKSIPEVIDHMEELQHELANSSLAPLEYFNQTYLIISKHVFAKMGTGHFSDNDVMNNFDINFAHYYFNALKNYVDNKKTTPAWKVTFDFCKTDTPLPLIYLALGANAHVNNDLPLSLLDSVGQADFKQDYDKVNKIITDSIPEVVTYVHEPTFYSPFMAFLIKRWRSKAWKNYISLKQNTITKVSIEQKANNTAIELAKIHTLKDYYHLFKILN